MTTTLRTVEPLEATIPWSDADLVGSPSMMTRRLRTVAPLAVM